MAAEVTGVVILGAARFRHIPEYSNPAFLRSKGDLQDYLCRAIPQGLGVPNVAVLDLFNVETDPGRQLRRIAEFLDELKEAHPEPDTLRNLIIYYVGHGYFGTGAGREYFLALAETDQAVPDMTGMRVTSLRDVLKQRAMSFRYFYLVDCCFAGQVLRDAMGAVDEVMASSLRVDGPPPPKHREVPRRGAAALCATSADDVAMARKGQGRTVFSDALVEVLNQGSRDLGERMTLSQVYDLTWQHIEKRQPRGYRVRPTLGSPDQSDGDVASRVALFPNPAYVGDRLSEGGTSPPFPGPPSPPAGLPEGSQRSGRTGAHDVPARPEGGLLRGLRGWHLPVNRVVVPGALLVTVILVYLLVGPPVAPPPIVQDCAQCPAMVAIPRGRFQMGSSPSEKDHADDESPVHPVQIPRAFWVSQYPVTRAQWKSFVNETAHADGSDCLRGQQDNHPVVCVSWEDAQDYVAWLTQKAGHPYRLLSESEFEYVDRAGSQSAYFWGDTPEGMPDYTRKRHRFDELPGTWPVGSFKPNAFHLYDMAGAVWSWTADCYNSTYNGAPADGRAWGGGDDCLTGHVVRGGSWLHEPRSLRAAYRFGGHDGRNDSTGFRVARTAG